MKFRHFLIGAGAVAALAMAGRSQAQDVKIGFILPMTGQQQSTSKQISAAVKLFMAQQGDTVAGKKVELIIKDDGAVPDNTKRIAQDLIVNDKVTFLAGFGVTPGTEAEINQNMPVLDNYDVLSNFEPLTDLPAPVVPADAQEQPADTGQAN